MAILLRFRAAPSITAALIAAPLAVLAQARQDAQPNIIVFVGDDLGWRDTGPYGNGFVRTPNIDRLARSGLRVQYAFGTTPQCSPSRISTLTRKYAHAVGAEDLHTPLPEGKRILPHFLQEQGYFTGHLAKTHYGPNAERQFQWYSPKIAEALPAFLDSAGTRPFFLWVGFHEPHRPYEPGLATSRHAPARVIVPPHLADTPETRQDLAHYYDAIGRMDEQIGLVLGELERRKLRDNTLVVFLSDNGAPFPREKGTLYDSGTRTPLIFSWPGHIRDGSVHDRGLVTTVDLAPTILELTGARAKAGRLTPAQRRLFEAPRARLELYDLAVDPWELHNLADDPRYAREVRELGAVLQKWMEETEDFPAAYRVRDDNTDRVTGVPFTTKILPLRNADVPPPGERWGRQGPT